jgi:sugar O-acyltransferase (sialic acid O-acetyltransferase NeuD family)
MKRLAVYGSGGFAREVAWLIEQCHAAGEPIECVAFVDDDPTRCGRHVHGLPVLTLHEAIRQDLSGVVVAVGSPQAREKIVSRVQAAGLALPTVIHPRVECSRHNIIAEGVVVCAGCILTTDVRVNFGVHVNLDCTIGHDVVIGEFSTLAPGVHISGWVHLGKRVYVGTGAVIINGSEATPLTIGDDAVIGAGACVVRPVNPGATVVGVPAKPRG